MLRVLVGPLCASVVQSPSVPAGLTLALADQGLLRPPGALALVLGDNIGTTITAVLAALKTDLAARRMARTNSISNVLGATYMVILFPFYVDLVVWFTQATTGLGPAELLVNWAKPNISRYVANAHTIFNVVNAIVMVSALPLLVRVGTALTPKRRERDHSDLMNPIYLDEGSLKTTPVALSHSRKEFVHMAKISETIAAEASPTTHSTHNKTTGDPAAKDERPARH